MTVATAVTAPAPAAEAMAAWVTTAVVSLSPAMEAVPVLVVAVAAGA